MSEELTYEQFKELLSEQANQIMNDLALAATGTLDVQIKIPSGIEALTDIAIGFTYLVEDMQALLREQQAMNQHLEERVAERTHELEEQSRQLQETLAELRSAQKRYVLDEWQTYTADWLADSMDDLLDEQVWHKAITTAIEKQQIVSEVNGEQQSTVAVPVNYGDELIGVLGFNSEEMTAWDEEDLAAVSDIAEQVGLALENQRLFEQTQQALATTEQQAKNLASLNEMAAELNTAISLDEIYRVAISRTLPIVNATYTSLIVLNHQTGTADSYSIADQSSEIDHQTSIDLSDSMAQRVLQTNQTILVDDTQNKNWLASEKDRKQAAALGARSLMLIPINVQARTWGLINIASSETNAFTTSQQSLMRQVVSLLESTLANQYLFDQTQMALSESETLYDFSARLNTASTLDEIVTAVVDATNAEVATLYLTENTGTLRKPAWAQVTTHWNIFNRPPSVTPGTRLDIQELPASEIWLTRPNEVAFIDNIAIDHRLSHKTRDILTEEGVKAAAWVPLVINRRWIGLVALNWTIEHKFTAIEQRLYKTISTQTAVAFSQYRLTQEIQERAANLEKLAEIETSLSQATTEENIIQVLAEYLAEKTHSVSLQYIETDRRNIPVSMTPVIMWREGNFEYNDPRLGKPIDPQKLPTAQLWINSPNNVVYVEDCNTDERLGEVGRQIYKQLNIQSTAILPLRSGGIWQGTIAISSPKPYKFSDEQKFLLDRILESASAILSSRRAQMAQRAALAETETLYNASVAFNRAESIDEILKVIEDTLITTGVSSIALSQLDVDENGRPTAQTITAIRSNGKRIVNDLINQTLDLGEPLPGTDLWINSPDEVQLVGDILNDPRTEKYPRTKEWLANMNIAAIAYLPLTLGTRWVGLVTIQWDSPYHFDNDDIRLYTTLAAQAATAVDGLILLQDTQTRAAQLEVLARVEGNLSQAVIETDILAALTANLPDIPMARLQYIDIDVHEHPTQTYTVATATEGELHLHETSKISSLSDSPFSQLWLDHPHQVLFISDVTKDNRLSAAQKDELLTDNIQALAHIPLQAAGRWQGSISLMWPEPHTFTTVENYVLDQSQEPIAAVVTSRRSQIEQKRAEEALRIAQEETQQLYNASRRINEAGNRLNEIAAALGEVRPLSKIDRVILMLFNYEGDVVKSVYVAGNWWKGTGPQPTPVGTEYPWETNASNLPFLFRRNAHFVDNPQTDPTIGKETKQFAVALNIKSIGVLPLLVGNRQVGTIILEASEIHEFTEDDKRVYASLLPQVAVAIENKMLLDESQTRARREQILREVTEKVRSSTDVDTIMKTAVQEVGRALGRKAVVYLNQIQDSQTRGQG